MLDFLHACAQRLDGVVVAHGDRLGHDHRARVDALVDVVDRGRGLPDAGREHVLDRVRARELGQRCRVCVHDSFEAVEERRPQQLHVPGADDERYALADEPAGHGRVSLLAALEVV